MLTAIKIWILLNMALVAMALLFPGGFLADLFDYLFDLGDP
jgi:hypothetical protein